MKTFKEIYEKAQKGYGVSTEDFVEAYEEEYPEAKLERIKKEHDVYIQCLDVMLKNFNPRWNPENKMKSDDFWLYFEIDGQRITTQKAHNYFLDLIKKNFELEREIARLKKELKK